jgi:hypothetical protein
MEWIWILIIGAPILGFIISVATKTPSQTLNEKFIGLGQLSGKTLQEIESVVGVANSVSSTIGADRETVFIHQWIQTAYHIVVF